MLRARCVEGGGPEGGVDSRGGLMDVRASACRWSRVRLRGRVETEMSVCAVCRGAGAGGRGVSWPEFVRGCNGKTDTSSANGIGGAASGGRVGRSSVGFLRGGGAGGILGTSSGRERVSGWRRTISGGASRVTGGGAGNDEFSRTAVRPARTVAIGVVRGAGA